MFLLADMGALSDDRGALSWFCHDCVCCNVPVRVFVVGSSRKALRWYLGKADKNSRSLRKMQHV